MLALLILVVNEWAAWQVLAHQRGRTEDGCCNHLDMPGGVERRQGIAVGRLQRAHLPNFRFRRPNRLVNPTANLKAMHGCCRGCGDCKPNASVTNLGYRNHDVAADADRLLFASAEYQHGSRFKGWAERFGYPAHGRTTTAAYIRKWRANLRTIATPSETALAPECFSGIIDVDGKAATASGSAPAVRAFPPERGCLVLVASVEYSVQERRWFGGYITGRR